MHYAQALHDLTEGPGPRIHPGIPYPTLRPAARPTRMPRHKGAEKATILPATGPGGTGLHIRSAAVLDRIRRGRIRLDSVLLRRHILFRREFGQRVFKRGAGRSLWRSERVQSTHLGPKILLHHSALSPDRPGHHGMDSAGPIPRRLPRSTRENHRPGIDDMHMELTLSTERDQPREPAQVPRG